jgi:hypothetical protein
MLVDGNQLAQILALQPRKQVLADEARGPGDNNFSR